MVQTVFHNLLIEAESMSDVHNCGTARPRYTYQEPLKLQNVDKVTEEDRALMDVARDMWAIEMYIAGLEAKLQALRALVK